MLCGSWGECHTRASYSCEIDWSHALRVLHQRAECGDEKYVSSD